MVKDWTGVLVLVSDMLNLWLSPKKHIMRLDHTWQTTTNETQFGDFVGDVKCIVVTYRGDFAVILDAMFSLKDHAKASANELNKIMEYEFSVFPNGNDFFIAPHLIFIRFSSCVLPLFHILLTLQL